MLRLFHSKKGQSTAEYAIVIGLVLAAAVAMQTFVKRGMQGKFKKAVDNFSSATGGSTGQYEPYYIQSDFEADTAAYKMTEKTTDGGGFEKHMGIDGGSAKTTTRSGYQKQRSWTEAQ